MYLSNEITSEWFFVGLNLQIPEGKLNHTKMNNPGNQQLIIYTVLSLWLKIGHNKSKEFFAASLKNTGRRDLHDRGLGQC